MISPNSYAISLAKKGQRGDGRKAEEYRKPVVVEYGYSSKSAEGSARVKIGDTEVIAGVKLGLGTPYSDRPGEGTIMVNAELLPMSSPEFESGPPSIKAIELSRVVDRGIRESHAIDFKKLCVLEGEKVWMIFIDIYPINADGNLFDAAALAALAALKDAKFPTLDKDNVVDYENRTEESVPLEKEPIACTVWKVGEMLLADPTAEEEDAAELRLTTAFTEKGEICAMQKGGSMPLNDEDLSKILDLAAKKTDELRKALKK